MVKTETKEIMHKETSTGIKTLLESIPDLCGGKSVPDELKRHYLNSLFK